MNPNKFDLFITSDYPPAGGGESTYFDLITNAYPEKCRVLTTKQATSTSETGSPKVTIERVANIRLLTPLLYLLHVILLMPRKQIRFIHCGQLRTAGFTCLLLKWLFNIPYGIHVYGGERSKFADNPLWRLLLKPVLDNAAMIFAISQWTKQQWIEYGLDADRIVIINPPVDVDKYHSLPDRDALRESLNIANRKVLLTICRLDPHKGTDMVIRALPELKKMFPDILFAVGGEGRMKDQLQSIARELHVEDNVQFMGRIPDDKMAEWYNAADIFIMPSRIGTGTERGVEGFGIVYLEANACGRPVIGGRSGGTSDSIEDGVSGILVDPTSIQEITDTIAKMFKNSNLLKELGENGQARATKQFSAKTIAQKLYDSIPAMPQ